jgi:iron complex outermembrane receptor protein
MEMRGGKPGGIAAGLFWLCASAASADEPSLADLRDLSIEQLANLQVTSVSRRPEALSVAPAAIDVITQEDIRRSGAQSLPEVLRLARNLEVARVDSQHYAISARGFNSFQAANKLLVLIDGRSVYTPLYSGVLWDQQLLMLHDVERIEVISGPGGSLWGANAVNGVINVITRSAAETHGLLAEAAFGSLDSRVDLRYGGQAGEVNYRIFANAFERGALLLANGDDANDAWRAGQVGFRTDWGEVENRFTVLGAYHDRLDNDGENYGGHLLARWTHLMRDGSSVEAQAYVASASAAEGGVFDELRTWDVSLQHTFDAGAHEIVWGGGYRVSDSEFINTTNPSTLVPARRTLRTANLFVQDEIALRDDLSLTLGVKLEDHTFTDLEYMPNVRLAWRPGEGALFWAAVSRAVRTPSRIDRDLVSPGVIVASDMQSEDLLAYELGYRTQPTSNTSVSANLFYHVYDGVRTVNLTPPGVLPAQFGNGLNGEVYGLEAWGDWAVGEDWRLSAGVTLLETDLTAEPLAIDFNGSGRDPSYQIFLRSAHQLAPDWTLDLDLRAIDSVPPQIPGYVELDGRLAWRVNDNVELALVGRNLFDEAHPESFDEGQLYQNRRSVYLTARLSY